MAEAARKGAISPLSFNEYNSQLQIAVLKATKNAAALPGDVNFYTSMNKDLAQEVNSCSSRVLDLTNKLLNLTASAETGSRKGKKRARLESVEDVQDNFRSTVVDAMDQLLERADIRLDEFRGLLKPPAIAVAPESTHPGPQKPTRKTTVSGRLDPAITNASYLPKPQALFKRKVNNANYSTSSASLRHKYNAQVPLGYRISDTGADEAAVVSSHPYQYEIKHMRYPPQLFRYAEPVPVKSFEETPFVWVDTAAQLADLLDKLRTVTEFAVDLEHHSYRTYSGFLCLMQISTRDCDYIIDTLALREELEELNEVFTDPKIVKVFHGAESDIVWLQQDFNIYVVNLFDTFHASKVLAFPRHSLATLLEMYCDFSPDKRYQLADWRIRPLPKEMLDYARSDTHYLLYIYDNLRNALLDRSGSRSNTPPEPSSSDSYPPATLLREVLSRSEDTALRVYEKELYDQETGIGANGWDALARKWNRAYLTPNNARSIQRLQVFKTVHSWRDQVARLEDESPRYVLPNHYLFSLAENPPADIAGLHNMFPSTPPMIRTRGKELLDAIRDSIRRLSSSKSEEQPMDDVVVAKELGIVASLDTAPVQIYKDPRANIFAPMPFNEDVPATQYSSLFGSAANVDRSAEVSGVFSTKRSSLFDFVQSLSTVKPGRFAFRDVLFRIHNDLSVAPSLPQVPESKIPDATEALENIIPDQVEIAYVPPEKRTATAPVVDDTIVVVGQKKRKRPKISKLEKFSELPEPQSITASESTPALDIIDEDGNATGLNPALDAVSVGQAAFGSNILDDGSDHEAESSRNLKKKRKGGGGGFYGDFKAPPKAHSQMQKGNVSRTFMS
ncbi:exosome nuclease subunit [Steccherinum ochraceum]|uniref:Exosome nuclease subunit n=1 Tax=Steccherinum ochraceum TaxID=92696 RepID=A0A4V2MVM1_9APHY|nr:exosome nuclease subunit [Steccherinum ochraceum]